MTKKKFQPKVVAGQDKEAEDAALAEAERVYRAACQNEVREILKTVAEHNEAGDIEGLMVLTAPPRDTESDKFMAYRNSGVDNNLMLWCAIYSIISNRLVNDAIEVGRTTTDLPMPDEPDPSLH